jgi:hypothetical protein
VRADGDHLALMLAAAGVAAVAAIGLAGWILLPGSETDWVNLVVLAPTTWGFVEAVAFMRRNGRAAIQERRYLRYMASTIFLFIILEAGPDLVIEAGWLGGEWAQSLVRVRGVLIGAALAAWGNFLPKLMSPWTVEEVPFDWQSVRRFGGKLAGIAGVVVSVSWLMTTEEGARLVTATSVLFVLASMIVWKVASRVSYSRRKRQAVE